MRKNEVLDPKLMLKRRPNGNPPLENPLLEKVEQKGVYGGFAPVWSQKIVILMVTQIRLFIMIIFIQRNHYTP